MPYCSADTFQIFLDQFSEKNANQFNILVLDNGAFHKAKSLKIPQNIGLIFLSPYSPELNPAEKMWQFLKKKFSGKLYNTLDEVGHFITKHTELLTPEMIISTCGFKYIFADINWTA